VPRGGERTPAHPAAVSGPGALSARTDGNGSNGQPIRRLPDAKYGESAEFEAAQQGAPLADEVAGLIPLGAPSQRPGEPVTAGAAAGPGIGPEAAGLHMTDDAGDYANMKPMIRSLEIMANLPGSNPSTRSFVRKLKGLGA
jgi:hypothetical protein